MVTATGSLCHQAPRQAAASVVWMYPTIHQDASGVLQIPSSGVLP